MKQLVNLSISQLVNSIFKCLIILFVISSCKKHEAIDSDTTAAQDYILVENSLDDIVNIGMQASYGSMTTYKLNPINNVYGTCATITFHASVPTDNDTLIINFGASCSGLDGRIHSGSIQYVYTGGFHYLDSSNVITVSTTNYMVDGNKITITSETIKNKGHITNENLMYSITANISILKAKGGTIQCTSNRTKVIVAGEQPNNLPIDWAHAQIAIYGTASGTSANGESFTANILQANSLVRNFDCTAYRKCFVAGEEDFTPANKPTRYINFGTGACDNQAIIAINGNLYNVTLP
ncbi:MAG: hypothetical protein ACYDCN_07010 [Bacteroidia bacterium]